MIHTYYTYVLYIRIRYISWIMKVYLHTSLGPWGLTLKEEVAQKIMDVIAYHASAVRKVGCITNKLFLPEPVRNAHSVAIMPTQWCVWHEQTWLILLLQIGHDPTLSFECKTNNNTIFLALQKILYVGLNCCKVGFIRGKRTNTWHKSALTFLKLFSNMMNKIFNPSARATFFIQFHKARPGRMSISFVLCF